MHLTKTKIIRLLKKYQFFAVGLIFLSVWVILFLIQAFSGWPGAIGFCNVESPCFCEFIDMDAILREKRQTWSNFSLIISGLAILFLTDRARQQRNGGDLQNPMAGATQFSFMYGLLTVNIGVGSFWFHASLLRYAEFMDVYAMNLYIIFFLSYNFTRYARTSGKIFLPVYISTGVVLGIVQWNINNPNIAVMFFSILAGIAMATEFILQIMVYKYHRFGWVNRKWLWCILGVGSFFLGFLIWNLSLPGEILCNPYSLLQGHAFWHWAVGAATFFFYLYLCSETQTRAQSRIEKK